MPKIELITRLKELHPLLQQLFDLSSSPGLSIGVLHQGNPIYTAHFGVRAANRPEPPDDNTLYNLASFTKLIAASIVASMVDDGLLSWDIPIREYLPQFRQRTDELGQQVTLADLLSNRSGLSGQATYWGQMSYEWLLKKEDIVPTSCEVRAVRPFREEFVYSTWGYGLVTAVVEEISHKPFSVCAEDRIFKPLGMVRSTTNVPLVDNVVEMHGIETSGKAYVFPWNPGWTDDTGFVAAAGARSSIKELLMMYKAMLHAYKHQTKTDMDSTPGSPFKYMRRIFKPHIGVAGRATEEVGYCLGAYRTTLPGNLSGPTINRILLGRKVDTTFGYNSVGTVVYHQNGARPGAFGALHLIPSINSAIVVLTNSLPLYDVCDYIAQLILGVLLGENQLPDYLSLAKSAKHVNITLYDKLGAFLEMGKGGTPPEVPLTTFEGNYRKNGGTFYFTVKIKSGKLELSCLSRPLTKYVLEPYGGNTFYIPLDRTTEICYKGMWPLLPPQTRIVTFDSNDHGQIISMSYHHDFTSTEPDLYTKDLKEAKARI
ncbi:beta-lactamase/transpeptidase-like protein [Tricladium varicosporioides]|nr:beta-lactamase/transpeptidase-like protein [Hymenoscyphus varicosporioides]